MGASGHESAKMRHVATHVCDRPLTGLSERPDVSGKVRGQNSSFKRLPPSSRQYSNYPVLLQASTTVPKMVYFLNPAQSHDILQSIKQFVQAISIRKKGKNKQNKQTKNKRKINEEIKLKKE